MHLDPYRVPSELVHNWKLVARRVVEYSLGAAVGRVQVVGVAGGNSNSAVGWIRKRFTH